MQIKSIDQDAKIKAPFMAHKKCYYLYRKHTVNAFGRRICGGKVNVNYQEVEYEKVQCT